MAIRGKLEQGNDMLVWAKDAVDKQPDPPTEIISVSSVIVNGYDEDDSDTQVITDVVLSNGGGGNNYYGLIGKAVTGAMTLGHIIRLEWLFDAGPGKYRKKIGRAKVVIPEEDITL